MSTPSGHIHDGTPKGTEQTIAGLPTYVASPKDGSKDKTVIFITDIFGYKLPNVRILADEYADQGLRVLIPDLFDGAEPGRVSAGDGEGSSLLTTFAHLQATMSTTTC